MKKTAFQLLSILLLMSACGHESGQKTVQNSNTSASAADPNLPPATYLEGIYATSTAPGKGVENLFDSNPATEWQTQPGTGPDEGIMLYFQEPQLIASVEIGASVGSFAKEFPHGDKPIQIYVNGQIASSGLPNEKISANQYGPVKSLFVRFGSTGQEETKKLRNDTYRYVYPNDASISVSEIKLLNTKGELLRVVAPLRLNGTITASSTLAPETAYSPANLFDCRKEFVWVEGSESSGEGEYLTFEFEQPVHITAMKIWNGYQRSDEHFFANTRVRDFDFGVKDGPVNACFLIDIKDGQRIELKSPAKGSVFEFKIKSRYPGLQYMDMALSDIVFYDGERPFLLNSKLPENYQSALRTKVASSPLMGLLDKRIANYMEEDLSSVTQSLILRSNGTFVMYSEAGSEGAPDISTYADGNWELLANGQVKVFGKFSELFNGREIYEGVTQKNPKRIFSDLLTISASKVTGTKMLGTFYLK